MALIDRGRAMIDYLENLGKKDSYKAKFEALCKAIDEAPSIDAVPVVHAHWAWVENRPIEDDDDPECIGCTGYECSACGNNKRTSVRFYEELSSTFVLELKEGLKESLTNYCHNCGAKMDMEVINND